MKTNRPSSVAFLVLGLVLISARCGPGFQTILIDEPLDGMLFDDPAPSLAVSARVSSTFPTATLEVRLDGVDLIGALGLTPPFSGAGGVVLIGADPVTVSGFDYSGSGNPRFVDLTLDGLPDGAHLIEVEGVKGGSNVVTRAVTIDLTGPLSLAAQGFASAGLPLGPLVSATEGGLANATLGQAAADGPIPISGGDALRPGFVPVAEAVIMGGGP